MSGPEQHAPAGARTPAPAFVLGHRPALDGLRGIACLLVMAHHINGLHGGFLGVDLFFVLSGFLISSLLLEEWRARGTIDLPRFFLRRALRLLPALVVFVLAMLALGHLVPGAARLVTPDWVVATLLYVVNWLMAFRAMDGASTQSAFVHCWSLAIEEQFYLLWPLALRWLLRRGVGLPGLARLLLAIVAYAGIARAVLVLLGGAGLQMRAYVGSDTRADGLALGCLLALLAHHGRLSSPRALWVRVALPLSLAFLAWASWVAEIGGRMIYLGGLSAASVAAAVLILVLLHPAELHPLARRLLESRALVATGRMSYGLYLWHLPVHVLFAMRFGPGWVTETVPWPVSFLVATLSFVLIERPFLGLKQRFGRRPAT